MIFCSTILLSAPQISRSHFYSALPLTPPTQRPRQYRALPPTDRDG